MPFRDKTLGVTPASIRAGYRKCTAAAIGAENLRKPQIPPAFETATAEVETITIPAPKPKGKGRGKGK